MQREAKRLLEHEVISPTAVMVSVRPEDRHGSAVMVSHKAAIAFARGLVADLETDAEANRA